MGNVITFDFTYNGRDDQIVLSKDVEVPTPPDDVKDTRELLPHVLYTFMKNPDSAIFYNHNGVSYANIFYKFITEMNSDKQSLHDIKFLPENRFDIDTYGNMKKNLDIHGVAAYHKYANVVAHMTKTFINDSDYMLKTVQYWGKQHVMYRALHFELCTLILVLANEETDTINTLGEALGCLCKKYNELDITVDHECFLKILCKTSYNTIFKLAPIIRKSYRYQFTCPEIDFNLIKKLKKRENQEIIKRIFPEIYIYEASD